MSRIGHPWSKGIIHPFSSSTSTPLLKQLQIWGIIHACSFSPNTNPIWAMVSMMLALVAILFGDSPSPLKFGFLSVDSICVQGKASESKTVVFVSIWVYLIEGCVFPTIIEQHPLLDLLWDCSCVFTNKETDSRKESETILCTLSKILKPFDDVLQTKDFLALVASWGTGVLSGSLQT